MLNINLFAGPGCGKSSVASELFAKMKKLHLNVEYVSEYAKDLVYGEDNIKLSDQIHILGEQHHKLFRLQNKVDFVIHDSPILLGIVYCDNIKNKHIRKKYISLNKAIFESHNNFNVFLKRNMDVEYQENGRNQNLIEAINKDYDVLKLISKYKFSTVKVDNNTADVILKQILTYINDKGDEK